jgi:hypothetical protein
MNESNETVVHHSDIVVLSAVAADTEDEVLGDWRLVVLRDLREGEDVSPYRFYSKEKAEEGLTPMYVNTEIDWTGFDEPTSPSPSLNPFTREEEHQYEALEAELTDLYSLPSAHEAYKGTSILADAIKYGPFGPERIKWPEYLADQMLDFYQAYNRRVHERKTVLREKLAEMIKGRSRYVENVS